MKTNIGQILKYHRLQSNMTQAMLSEGIISISYLSKIENGKIQPSEEIVDLLSKKLNVNYLLMDKCEETTKICNDWFHYLLLGNKEKSNNLYNKIFININNNSIVNNENINLIEIHKLRFYLIIDNKIKALAQYNYLKRISKSFNNIEKYYWLKFSGNYHFSCQFYKRSLSSYQQAENLYPKVIEVPKMEINDLLYAMAITASKLRKVHLVLMLSSNALKYYQNVYNIKRCAECHILLGISYQRIGDTKEAMENYQLAINIANTINDNEILILCNQNIGNLYSIINNTVEAIKHFKISYKLRNNSSYIKKMIPISSLLKEYYNTADIIKSKKWLKKGLALSESLKESNSFYVYEFKVFDQLINGRSEFLVPLITQEILPYLNERQLNHEKIFYLKILARYYFINNKYKLSATYYKYATEEFINILMNRGDIYEEN